MCLQIFSETEGIKSYRTETQCVINTGLPYDAEEVEVWVEERKGQRKCLDFGSPD